MEQIEFDIVDIMHLHRGWITKLHVEDLRSEAEIVQILQELRFTATVTQVRQCLSEWNVLRVTLPTPPMLPLPLVENRAEHTVPAPPFIPRSQELNDFPCSGHDLEVLDSYTKRPLPLIPTSKTLGNQYQKLLQRNVHLELVSNSPPDEKEPSVEVDSFLEDDASMMDNYVTSDQPHERLAVGLPRIPRPRGDSEVIPRVFRMPRMISSHGVGRRPCSKEKKKDQEEESEQDGRP